MVIGGVVFIEETRVDSDGTVVEAGGFIPSTSPRFTRDELLTTARVVTATAPPWPEYPFSREVPCPCCAVPIPRGELLEHVQTPPWWCDQERWGSWGEAEDYFD